MRRQRKTGFLRRNKSIEIKMGMTYRIIALPKGATAEEWCNQTIDSDFSDDSALIGSKELVNDRVFDRERLAAWCGLKREDWAEDGVAVLEQHHVRRAREVLQRLVDRIAAMPFTPDPPIGHLQRDPDTDGVGYVYVGSPENVAIVREVENVLQKTYHFTYKWQQDRPFGVPHMINALDDVLAFMESNPDRVVLALYY